MVKTPKAREKVSFIDWQDAKVKYNNEKIINQTHLLFKESIKEESIKI
jgi:hypothetical protein